MRRLGTIAVYLLLAALAGTVVVLAVQVVRSAGYAERSEHAAPCAAAGERGCRFVEEATVVRTLEYRGAEGDPDTYEVVVEPDRRIEADRDAFEALHPGDRVRIVSYDGEVTHLLHAGGDSATGAYTDSTRGYTVMLWIAVPLLACAAGLAVAWHRSGVFEGYLLFVAVIAVALFMMCPGLLVQAGLARLIGPVPAAFTGAVLLATAAFAGWRRGVADR